jgi:hypothetical protein
MPRPRFASVSARSRRIVGARHASPFLRPDRWHTRSADRTHSQAATTSPAPFGGVGTGRSHRPRASRFRRVSATARGCGRQLGSFQEHTHHRAPSNCPSSTSTGFTTFTPPTQGNLSPPSQILPEPRGKEFWIRSSNYTAELITREPFGLRASNLFRVSASDFEFALAPTPLRRGEACLALAHRLCCRPLFP